MCVCALSVRCVCVVWLFEPKMLLFIEATILFGKLKFSKINWVVFCQIFVFPTRAKKLVYSRLYFDNWDLKIFQFSIQYCWLYKKKKFGFPKTSFLFWRISPLDIDDQKPDLSFERIKETRFIFHFNFNSKVFASFFNFRFILPTHGLESFHWQLNDYFSPGLFVTKTDKQTDK